MNLAPVDDIDRIMDILVRAFDPAFGEAWTRRQLEDSLVLGNCHYVLIAPDGALDDFSGQAAGFTLSRHGFDEEELLLFAVNPDFRKRGLGTKLLERLTSDAFSRGAERLLLEMRASNPAEALYRSFGFMQVGQRKDYYRAADGTRYDALTFCLILPQVA